MRREGRRTGSLLELARLTARDGSRNKNRMKEMKRGPQQSAANKGTSLNWNNKGGRLLAWIGDQVRLKAFSAQRELLYTEGGTASCYNGNKSEPIWGELKRKGAIS